MSEALLTDAGAPIQWDVAEPFLYRTVVETADLDVLGHVNNAAYLRWMDRAAYAASSAAGWDWAAYRKLGACFVVRRHEVDYLHPAGPGDRIMAATWVQSMDRCASYRRHQMVRMGDGRTVLRALTQWVFVELRTGRPRRIPREVVAAFPTGR